MLKFQAEITNMLVLGRNYCCSWRVYKLDSFYYNDIGLLSIIDLYMNEYLLLACS